MTRAALTHAFAPGDHVFIADAEVGAFYLKEWGADKGTVVSCYVRKGHPGYTIAFEYGGSAGIMECYLAAAA